MNITRDAEGGRLFWFTGRDRPFRIDDEQYCLEPDCPCTSVNLELVESDPDGTNLPRPTRFSLWLDLTTRQETKPPRRSPEAQTLVEEFLRDLPQGVIDHLEAARKYLRRAARKLETCTIDVKLIHESRMVTFAQLLCDDPDDLAECSTHWFAFMHKEAIYFVDDCYCPNPSCRCKEVVLTFMPAQREGDRLVVQQDLFSAKLTLAGRAEIDSLHACSREQALGLLAEFRRQRPDLLEMLRGRYKTVKKVGRRSLKAAPAVKAPAPQIDLPPLADPRLPAIEQLVRDALPGLARAAAGGERPRKIGPNAPCPCGSGKKYKKCCGRWKGHKV